LKEFFKELHKVLWIIELVSVVELTNVLENLLDFRFDQFGGKATL